MQSPRDILVTSAISKWAELQQQLLCVTGIALFPMLPPPFLAWRALERGYVAGTFDYNMMINYSNSS